MNPKIAYQRTKLPINYEFMTKRQKARFNKLSFKPRGKGWRQIELPCGECPACKLAKSNEWATRIECEARTYNHKGIFVTLTYNNPNLPINDKGLMTLNKQDIKNFKKKLRKYLAKHPEKTADETGKIRTFECGEYGPTTHRPHYHQIIFNYIPNDLKYKHTDARGFPLYTSKTLQKIWGKGFVIIGTISWQSASYVARYTFKKQGLTKQKRQYYDALETDEETGELYMTKKWHIKKGDIEPEFITMSNREGIGAQYFKQHINQIQQNNGILITIDSKTHLKPIPRYFKKIWEKINWRDYHKWKYKCQQISEQQKLKLADQYDLPGKLPEQKIYFLKLKQLENQSHKFGLIIHRDNILYEHNTN